MLTIKITGSKIFCYLICDSKILFLTHGYIQSFIDLIQMCKENGFCPMSTEQVHIYRIKNFLFLMITCMINNFRNIMNFCISYASGHSKYLSNDYCSGSFVCRLKEKKGNSFLIGHKVQKYFICPNNIISFLQQKRRCVSYEHKLLK
ncbi:hypothetical protein AK88_04222 [Plasmodium fragile]|uniref:Uncharacterized protein n=1 Tax=Plasmodium fragile TaxID=5857 RepID=A0A0D9QKD3_PLAFR|nr:uncharacterized protein AK88_04222 [Plasmodium fragile]KJP86171.1 hypothetical protein AK88_04222 [Plasmodium fragile]